MIMTKKQKNILIKYGITPPPKLTFGEMWKKYIVKIWLVGFAVAIFFIVLTAIENISYALS